MAISPPPRESAVADIAQIGLSPSSHDGPLVEGRCPLPRTGALPGPHSSKAVPALAQARKPDDENALSSRRRSLGPDRASFSRSGALPKARGGAGNHWELLAARFLDRRPAIFLFSNSRT